MPNFIIPILLLVDGAAFILAAVFAQNIGLDPNVTWGRSPSPLTPTPRTASRSARALLCTPIAREKVEINKQRVFSPQSKYKRLAVGG
jgi:hypothetical protein